MLCMCAAVRRVAPKCFACMRPAGCQTTWQCCMLGRRAILGPSSSFISQQFWRRASRAFTPASAPLVRKACFGLPGACLCDGVCGPGCLEQLCLKFFERFALQALGAPPTPSFFSEVVRQPYTRKVVTAAVFANPLRHNDKPLFKK